MRLKRIVVAALIAAVVLSVGRVVAEESPAVATPAAAAPAEAPPGAAAAAVPPAAAPPSSQFSAEQLEQIVAPVALYPDALLMQILMASTYPLELIEAERWSKKNADLKGDAIDQALTAKNWDPSVKSLTHFPTVLTRMSENLDWTKDMGDAFLGQQKEVLDAIQRMRHKAHEQGNLKSTPEQTVIVEQAPPQVIKIEPAQPEVVYVPTYSSTVIYGAPPPVAYYPAVYAYPPGYVATASLLSFGMGMAVGAALWGDCDWGHNEVNINSNRNVNRNVNRGDRGRGDRGRAEQWRHNPQHRRGVNYRNDAVAKKYGQPGATNRAARENARGYQRPASPQTRPSRGSAGANPPRRAAGGAASSANRPAAGQPSRAASRPAATSRDTAFGGRDSGRSQRAASERGAASRGADRGSFGRAQASRGGGFSGGRGGGGAGGGRGGGGGRRR